MFLTFGTLSYVEKFYRFFKSICIDQGHIRKQAINILQNFLELTQNQDELGKKDLVS